MDLTGPAPGDFVNLDARLDDSTPQKNLRQLRERDLYGRISLVDFVGREEVRERLSPGLHHSRCVQLCRKLLAFSEGLQQIS